MFCWGGGGEVANAYPLVVVESDTVRVSGLHYNWLSQIQRECLSCLSPVVSSRPFFWGKVALDVGRSGRWPAMSPSGHGGNLADFDRRASQLVCAAPGVTLVDSSEEGVPVRELIRPFSSGKAPG